MSEKEITSYCEKNNIELLVADMAGKNIFKTEIANKKPAINKEILLFLYGMYPELILENSDSLI